MVSPAPAPPAVATAHFIRVRGVHRSFGGQQVLQGVDLDVPVGATTAILGASGVGKSVLLRLMLGLLPVDGHHAIDAREPGAMRGEPHQQLVVHAEVEGRIDHRLGECAAPDEGCRLDDQVDGLEQVGICRHALLAFTLGGDQAFRHLFVDIIDLVAGLGAQQGE